MLTAVRRNRGMGGLKKLPDYLKFTALENCQVIFNIESNVTPEYVEYVEYSLNGKTWTHINNTNTGQGADISIYIPLQNGETVMFRGKAVSYANPNSGTNWYSSFGFTGNVSASGNIMSLLNPQFEDLTTLNPSAFEYLFQSCDKLITAPTLPATTLAKKCYYNMFTGCEGLISAPELPSMVLAEMCYDNMFSGCTSLVNAPALPATDLTPLCYSAMFSGCTSLVNAPALPATKIAYQCYNGMFNGCTSLVNAPALPATDLELTGSVWYGCYQNMFRGCTSLVNAPALPATKLSNYCYQAMFYRCISLVTAPVLPAQTLKSSCYKEMFYGCTLLNKITMLGTYLSGALSDWVRNVAAAGTFVKRSDVTNIPSGNSGIPTGWTVEDYVG